MRSFRRAAMLLVAVDFLMLSPLAALAHVTVSPNVIGPNEFGTFTFTVPNESENQDTVGVDVRLPKGFILEDAQQLAGWTTVVDTGVDGIPVAVHWRGGALAPGSFATFALRGRTPDSPGQLAFPTTQRLERTTESWTGTPDSENPAPTVDVSSQAAGGSGASDGVPSNTSSIPAVPLASAPGTGAGRNEGVDDLARSRASLALTLAAAALIAGLVGLAIGLRRRYVPEGKAADTTTNAESAPRKSAKRSPTGRAKSP